MLSGATFYDRIIQLTQTQYGQKAYCPFDMDITWKMFFAWRFIITENILFVDHILAYLSRNHLSFLFLCYVLKYLP